MQISSPDDLLPERNQRSPCHLERAHAEGDANDRDAQETPDDEVFECEPPAREDEPKHVADDAYPDSPCLGGDEDAAERPERITGELQRLLGKRQADDRDRQ